MFCTKCGKEIPEGMTSCPDCNSLNQTKTTDILNFSNFLENIKNGLSNLQGAKNWLFITLALFIVNFIMKSLDMVGISVIFSEREDSFYSILKYLNETCNFDDANYLMLALTICSIATVLSIILMILPIILNKPYAKRYLLLNVPTMIFIILVYGLLIIAFADSDNSGANIEIKLSAYLYLVESVLSIISSIILKKKIKALK